jgi:hypothetical protein
MTFAGFTTGVSGSCVPRSLLPVFSFMEEISDWKDLLEKRTSADKIHPIEGSDTFDHVFTLIRLYRNLGMLQPILTQANPKRKEVKGMKTKKKGMGKQARGQEAKFWAMMRAAEPGKRCLK